MKTKLLLVFILLIIAGNLAMGQTKVDYTLEPKYGSLSLNAGFPSDPFQVGVETGGRVDGSYLGGGCAGFVAVAPDFRLNWKGSASRLFIYFKPTVAGNDATILINLPDGSWLCNDDAPETVNPMVVINNPKEGQYDIWIGSYEQGQYYTGNLFISELDSYAAVSGSTAGVSSSQGSGNSLDFTLDPHFGSVSLSAGFTNDPHAVSVTSGGVVNVSNASIGSGCTGFASRAPDFTLNWTGSTTDLRVYFQADSSTADATLIINTPNGQWVCNDDANSETLNPLVNLSGYGAGRYDIWVGSYSEGENISGSLKITELSSQQP